MQESDTFVMVKNSGMLCASTYRAHDNYEQIWKDNHLPFFGLLK